MPKATLCVGCGGGSDRDSRLFWFIPYWGMGDSTVVLSCGQEGYLLLAKGDGDCWCHLTDVVVC